MLNKLLLLGTSTSVLIAVGAAVSFQTPGADRPQGEGSSAPTPAATSEARSDDELTPQAEFLAVAERIDASQHPNMGRGQVARLRAELEKATKQPMKRAKLQNELSRHLLRIGDVDEALELAELAWEFVESAGETEQTPEVVQARRQILITRAQCYLRKAEVENCIARHNRDCCIFPIQGGGVHEFDEPARKGLAIYLELAAVEPENLAHRWMCNLLAMALGDHPGALPEALVMPPKAFESEFDLGRFPDVADRVGADLFGMAGGTAVEDYDGDGLLDFAVSNCDPRGRLTILMNDGKGGYLDRSVEAGVEHQLGGLNLTSADYDSDGDADLYVIRGAWLLNDGNIRDSLLRNDGKGNFTDVTRSAGVAEPASPDHSAVFGDFDNDGDVDLYAGNEAYRAEDKEHYGLPSQLFLNDGDGTFTPSAEAKNERYCKGVAAGDYDNDGDLDLYVSNIGDEELGQNRLYRNDGVARFEDVAKEAGVEPPAWSFATWFFDYDNDGWLDIYVSGYDAKVTDLAAHYLGLPDTASRPGLYHNEGGGKFRDAAKEMGLDRPLLPMGAGYGDFDNDGWLDIYLGTGNPPYDVLMPNVALRNDGGKRFQDVTSSAGMGHLQKGHGVAFADLDNDGDQDVYHDLGGFNPGDVFANVLYENPGHGNHFLQLELQGTKSNRPAIGARVRVVLETEAGERELHRAVGSVSSFGGGHRRLEIGLGDAVRIKAVEIRWPRTSEVQRFEDVPLDALVRIVEGAPKVEVLTLKPAPFRE